VELPRLEPLWQKYKDQGLTVIAIESQQDREGALEFMAEHGLTYPMVEDLEGDDNVCADKLQIYGYPTSYLVDRSGRIMYSHIGFDEGDEVKLEEEIQKLLKS
jgi:peroxiredoxin